MLIGLITYRLRANSTLGDIGIRPASADPGEHRRVKMWTVGGVALIALLVVLTMAGVLHPNAVAIAQKMTYAIVGLAIVYFIYLFAAGGLDAEERKRVVVIFLLFIFASIFWSAFEQAPTSGMSFAMRTAGPPYALAHAAQAAVYAVDPTQPVTHVRTMEMVVTERLAGVRSYL